jgi:hypothetical protein
VIKLGKMNKNQENELGGVWGTYRKEKMCVQGFLGKDFTWKA